LGDVYHGLAAYDKTERHWSAALALRRGVLGADDLETYRAMSKLGHVLMHLGRMDEAIALGEEWLGRSRQKLGPDHKVTLYGLSTLAGTYRQAKEFDRAEPVYRELLDVQSRKLPPDHSDRANTLASLGQCLLEAGKSTDAEPVLRDCLAIRERKEPDTWTTFHTKSLLGGTLAAQKKYADAEPLLLKGYEGMKARKNAIPRVARDRLSEASESLVQLYDGWGKPDEAGKWRTELTAEKERLTKSK
jgi:tetratricopeptide (TPR) repeat protein